MTVVRFFLYLVLCLSLSPYPARCTLDGGLSVEYMREEDALFQMSWTGSVKGMGAEELAALRSTREQAEQGQCVPHAY